MSNALRLVFCAVFGHTVDAMRPFLRFTIVCRFLLPLLCVPFAAADAADANWVLAARTFTFARTAATITGAEQVATLLPQLILEQIADGSSRVLPANEVLDRKLDALLTERLSLFLQLSKEYKTRDALVLTNVSPRTLERQLSEEQRKIAEIERKIDENLAQVEREAQDAAPRIAREEAIARGEDTDDGGGGRRRFSFQVPLFGWGDEEERPVSERVTLYRNDITALFTPSEKALEAGCTSRTFEKEALAAHINGLLSGSLMVFGDYISVTVDLNLYPGCRTAGTITEIGQTSDLLPLAKRIVRALAPKLSNSLPVVVRIDVLPEEAAHTASLTMDGIVFAEIPQELVVDAAIHTLSVSASGYETATLTYQFEGRERYHMRVSLVPEEKGVLSLRLKKLKDGMFYANGVDSVDVTEDEPYAAITVNGKSVLGIFTTGAGESETSAFFYIPAQWATEGTNLVVNAKPYDRAANIDKRRRSMYTAYTALICSLPFTFFCVGNFTAVNNGYMLGRTTYDDAVDWQQRMYGTLGITVVCGAWTVFELIRYLHAANGVLPAQTRAEKRAEKPKTNED